MKFGDALAVGTVIVIASLWACLIRLADWFGSWGETSRALETATILTYPLTAAAASWLAGGPKRQRFSWLVDSSTRTPLELYCRLIVSVAAMTGFPALLVGMGLNVATATEATYGEPVFLSLFAISCGYIAAAAFGVLVGRLLPSYIAPVACVVLVYGTSIVVNASNPSVYPLAGLSISDSRERTYRETASWMLATRSAWLLAIAALLAAWAARRRSAWPIPFAVSCLLAVPLLFVGDAGMSIQRPALSPVCHHPTDEVRVCFTAARDHAYDEFWNDASPVIDILSGLFVDGVTLREETIPPGATGSRSKYASDVPFGLVNGFNGNAHVGDGRQLQAELLGSILLMNCADYAQGTAGLPLARANDVIANWAYDALGRPGSGTMIAFPQFEPAALDYSGVEDFRSAWRAARASQHEDWLEANSLPLLNCSADDNWSS